MTPRLTWDTLKAISDFIHPRSSFFDVFPKLLDRIVDLRYDAKTRTVYGLKHSRNDEPFFQIGQYGAMAIWYRFDRRHRDHGPAVIEFDHREDAGYPSRTHEELFERMIRYQYYYRGLRHRTDGPAVIYYEREEWHSFGAHVPFGNNKRYFCDIKLPVIPDIVFRLFPNNPTYRQAHNQPPKVFDRRIIELRKDFAFREQNEFVTALKHYDWAVKNIDNPVNAKFIESTEDMYDVDEKGDSINIQTYKHFMPGSTFGKDAKLFLCNIIGAAMQRSIQTVPQPLSAEKQVERASQDVHIIYRLIHMFENREVK